MVDGNGGLAGSATGHTYIVQTAGNHASSAQPYWQARPYRHTDIGLSGQSHHSNQCATTFQFNSK